MPHSLKMIRLGVIYLIPALFICCTAGAAILCVNPNGSGNCKSTIGAAVAAASPGDTIQVSPGVYKEQVTITKTLSLIPKNDLTPPTIDATGLSNGILINGMSAAPGIGVAHVLVSGFNIHNANYEGILVVNGSDIAIVGNHVFDNNKGLDLNTSPVSCPGIPEFETSEQMDCGEGIHLVAAYHATIINNTVESNSGGILITDETGPSYSNLVANNSVHENPYACGITMASHPPATSVIPSAKGPFQIYRNTISGNHSSFNGLGIPGAGAGVGIFAAGPGNGSYENVIINNNLHNNGLPGVTMHNHAVVPGTPAANLNDNVISGNTIMANAPDTADAATSGPTGINIYSLVPVTGTLISNNTFSDESIDIAFNVPTGSEAEAHFNNFSSASTGVNNLGSGDVTATGNWWGCAGGPKGGSGCSKVKVSGGTVSFTPWLSSPFD